MVWLPRKPGDTVARPSWRILFLVWAVAGIARGAGASPGISSIGGWCGRHRLSPRILPWTRGGGGTDTGDEEEDEALPPTQQRRRPHAAVLEYGLFGGNSAMRGLPEDVLTGASSTRASLAVDLIEGGFWDAAHEAVLGVTPGNLREAEEHGRNRGTPGYRSSSWYEDHPPDDLDDHVHSLIHRIEGPNVGEGGHTGFANAKYWAAGGPKKHAVLPASPVSAVLSVLATRHCPELVREHALVAPSTGQEHMIIAGGGKHRAVAVAPGSWDSIAWIDAWEAIQCANDDDEQPPQQDDDETGHRLLLERQAEKLHDWELRLLRRYADHDQNPDAGALLRALGEEEDGLL